MISRGRKHAEAHPKAGRSAMERHNLLWVGGISNAGWEHVLLAWKRHVTGRRYIDTRSYLI